MGQVCAKHNEFYEAECRWCEPPAPAAVIAPNAPVGLQMAMPRWIWTDHMRSIQELGRLTDAKPSAK